MKPNLYLPQGMGFPFPALISNHTTANSQQLELELDWGAGWKWAENRLGMGWEWAGNGSGFGLGREWAVNGPEWSGNCLEVELDWKWAGNGIRNGLRNGLEMGWDRLEVG